MTVPAMAWSRTLRTASASGSGASSVTPVSTGVGCGSGDSNSSVGCDRDPSQSPIGPGRITTRAVITNANAEMAAAIVMYRFRRLLLGGDAGTGGGVCDPGAWTPDGCASDCGTPEPECGPSLPIGPSYHSMIPPTRHY